MVLGNVLNTIGITDVEGIRVGHYTDVSAATGCTVVLCEQGAVAGVDVRGSAPGTRETDLLGPTYHVNEVHAVLLSGGSAFGLDAASGVMRYLEERDIGYDAGVAKVPIVPAAILFDLGLVQSRVRPGADEGYAACEAAASGPFEEGSVGAGTGATVGKVMGAERRVKGGIGTASIKLDDGLVVGAVVAVNSIGGIYDPDTGDIVAGPQADGGEMLDSMQIIISPDYRSPGRRPRETNTTIGVVATNARLDKAQANKLASIAHDGIALAVRPAHLMGDGDTLFALSTGAHVGEFQIDQVLAAGVQCVAWAIVRGVEKARGIGGVPGVRELSK